MVKVVTTNASKNFGVKIAEFHKIMPEGVEFEVTEDRFDVLSGNNSFGIKFVNKVEQCDAATESVINPEPETPDIYVIEPGKEPVKMVENSDGKLEPEAIKPAPTSTTRKKRTQTNTESNE